VHSGGGRGGRKGNSPPGRATSNRRKSSAFSRQRRAAREVPGILNELPRPGHIVRSLTDPNRRRIIGKRDRYEAMFRALLAAGIRRGAFEVRDIRLMTIAILTTCSGVVDWFSRQGRLGAADAYARTVLGLLKGSVGPRPRAGDCPSRGRSAPRETRCSADDSRCSFTAVTSEAAGVLARRATSVRAW
jgi:tetracycline repressor-like protein